MAVFLLVVESALVNVQQQLFRQRIDHADTDTVQTTGNLVAVVVELATGVQHGHDHFGSRHFAIELFAHLLVFADRDTATVVGNRHRAVGMDVHRDVVCMASQGFVDRVVDNLEHHVMQTGAVMDVADIHAGTLADRLQAFQCSDAVGIVRAIARRVGVLFFAHCACHRLRMMGRGTSSARSRKGGYRSIIPVWLPCPRLSLRARVGRPHHVPRGTH